MRNQRWRAFLIKILAAILFLMARVTSLAIFNGASDVFSFTKR
ncbi:hypothetical protein LTSEUGA_1249 [Salmonella enterica subsp. enterica serovar Uganda str. R8-3404]|uniref:Uncharacterized protein n=1 Tax=Salmonella enterica subsp. enterica serovar Uganda str. R8-3404 TaxID=913083 RepID=A0A6C8H634_SALET|nr:hypothetical protein LTSEUGA_1249 [Salmonella enterica subsp. enterica serovar Uganda str. R8-3404]